MLRIRFTKNHQRSQKYPWATLRVNKISQKELSLKLLKKNHEEDEESPRETARLPRKKLQNIGLEVKLLYSKNDITLHNKSKPYLFSNKNIPLCITSSGKETWRQKDHIIKVHEKCLVQTDKITLRRELLCSSGYEINSTPCAPFLGTHLSLRSPCALYEDDWGRVRQTLAVIGDEQAHPLARVIQR